MSEQYFIDKIRRRCGQIRKHCEEIQEYVSETGCKEFVNDEKYIDLTALRIRRIGDIMLKLNDNFKNANPHVRWRKVIGLRNTVKHDFIHIDKHALWRFAKHENPVIIAGLDNLVLDYDLIADTTNNVLTLEEIRSLCVPLFKRHDVTKAILYGSYAKGEATDHSDLDLLVESNNEDCDVDELGDALELALEKHVDIFDAKRLGEDSPIRLAAQKEGIVLYEIQPRQFAVAPHGSACPSDDSENVTMAENNAFRMHTGCSTPYTGRPGWKAYLSPIDMWVCFARAVFPPIVDCLQTT